MSDAEVRVGGHRVRGVDVGPATRCAHYDSPRDVVAIRLPCCDSFYPCAECHDAVADHERERWSATSFDAAAVLCGVCGETLTVEAYLDCDHACPHCGAAFNPGCEAHHDRYFSID